MNLDEFSDWLEDNIFIIILGIFGLFVILICLTG